MKRIDAFPRFWCAILVGLLVQAQILAPAAVAAELPHCFSPSADQLAPHLSLEDAFVPVFIRASEQAEGELAAATPEDDIAVSVGAAPPESTDADLYAGGMNQLPMPASGPLPGVAEADVDSGSLPSTLLETSHAGLHPVLIPPPKHSLHWLFMKLRDFFPVSDKQKMAYLSRVIPGEITWIDENGNRRSFLNEMSRRLQVNAAVLNLFYFAYRDRQLWNMLYRLNVTDLFFSDQQDEEIGFQSNNTESPTVSLILGQEILYGIDFVTFKVSLTRAVEGFSRSLKLRSGQSSECQLTFDLTTPDDAMAGVVNRAIQDAPGGLPPALKQNPVQTQELISSILTRVKAFNGRVALASQNGKKLFHLNIVPQQYAATMKNAVGVQHGLSTVITPEGYVSGLNISEPYMQFLLEQKNVDSVNFERQWQSLLQHELLGHGGRLTQDFSFSAAAGAQVANVANIVAVLSAAHPATEAGAVQGVAVTYRIRKAILKAFRAQGTTVSDATVITELHQITPSEVAANFVEFFDAGKRTISIALLIDNLVFRGRWDQFLARQSGVSLPKADMYAAIKGMVERELAFVTDAQFRGQEAIALGVTVDTAPQQIEAIIDKIAGVVIGRLYQSESVYSSLHAIALGPLMGASALPMPSALSFSEWGTNGWLMAVAAIGITAALLWQGMRWVVASRQNRSRQYWTQQSVEARRGQDIDDTILFRRLAAQWWGSQYEEFRVSFGQLSLTRQTRLISLLSSGRGNISSLGREVPVDMLKEMLVSYLSRTIAALRQGAAAIIISTQTKRELLALQDGIYSALLLLERYRIAMTAQEVETVVMATRSEFPAIVYAPSDTVAVFVAAGTSPEKIAAVAADFSAATPVDEISARLRTLQPQIRPAAVNPAVSKRDFVAVGSLQISGAI